MISYKESTVLTPHTYICDVCKSTYSYDKDIMEIQESFNHKWTAGYRSKLQDGDEYEINICQSCFMKPFEKYIRKL
jgi:hypothetical protein